MHPIAVLSSQDYTEWTVLEALKSQTCGRL